MIFAAKDLERNAKKSEKEEKAEKEKLKKVSTHSFIFLNSFEYFSIEEDKLEKCGTVSLSY